MHQSQRREAAARRRPSAGFAAAVLAAVALAAGCAGQNGSYPIPPGSNDPLLPARAALAEGHDVDAAAKLNAFLRDNPGSALVDEANYLLGLASLQQKDRVLAADFFQRVLRDYPQSRFAADASYHLAVAYDELSRPSQLDQDWTEKAITSYQAFTARYPERPEAAHATERVKALEDRLAKKAYDNAVLYMKMHAYSAAAVYFKKCLDEHPDSRWSCRASLGLGESWWRSGRFSQAAGQLKKVLDGCSADPDVRSRAENVMAKVRQELAARPPAAADTSGAADSASTP